MYLPGGVPGARVSAVGMAADNQLTLSSSHLTAVVNTLDADTQDVQVPAAGTPSSHLCDFFVPVVAGHRDAVGRKQGGPQPRRAAGVRRQAALRPATS